MQERVVDEHQVEQAVSRWYLSRDGQQHGPLTDRELSVFAESGKFQPGDLLWADGLDGWKPADAVFGLGSSQATAPAAPATPETTVDAGLSEADETSPDSVQTENEPISEDVDGEHVGAIVKALNGETEPPKLSPKERAMEELRKFSGTCAYLWVVFALLALHAWVGEARYGGTFSFFVLTTINAFWLMKLLPLVEDFGPLQELKRKPLVYSIVAKTVLFSALLFAAYAVETIILGWIGGGGLQDAFSALAGGIAGTAMLWLIFCVALLPYFAFKELERAVGADMIRKLLLGAR